MNGISGYEGKLEEVQSLMSRAKFAEALQRLDELLQQWPDQPALLVLHGELIQLQNETGLELEEAAAAFKRATKLDPRNADAWLELGQFQYAVKDNAKTAEKTFAQAIAVASETLVAALIGRAGALEELGRKREAFDCLHAARSLQNADSTSGNSEFQELDLFERWESLIRES
jgi:tetratricopeptide (TPR) repeat protein